MLALLLMGAYTRYPGWHQSLPLTYISGTGTAGTDNTAMTVLSRTLPANTLQVVGDRLRIRAYFRATGGAADTGTVTLNTVPVSTASVGGTTITLTETWLHYIDSTHANILEQHPGGLGELAAVNVAGFNWAAAQTMNFTQTAVNNQHLILFAMIVDKMPLGV